MLQPKNGWRFLIFVLTVSALVGCRHTQIEFVAETHHQLLQEYVDPDSLDHPKLFNAALEKAAEVLKNEKIDFVYKKIADKTPLARAQDQFREQFSEALRLANKAKSLKENELIFAAAAALLAAVGDSHTYFISPEGYQEYLKRRSGKAVYSGIGARIKKLEDNFFYLERVFPGGPAMEVGLERFDRIIAIDGKPVPPTAKEISSLVRGEKGTEVGLTIERNGSARTIKLKRDGITLPPTEYRIVRDNENSYGYILIYSFEWIATEMEVYSNIADLKRSGAKGIIIDLRGNPGGNILSLNSTLALFLPSGTATFSLRGKDGVRNYQTKSSPLTDLPVVVLVDEESGSAAEVFAAVMQEWARATIVGKKSAGAVNAGIVFPLSRGAAAMITVDHLATAKGRVLENNGVNPDIVVELMKDDIQKAKDAQLEKAIEKLKQITSKK